MLSPAEQKCSLPSMVKAAAALEHEHHCVAAGGVCTDLLALGEDEQRDADGVILGKRLADDLPGLGLDLLCKREHLLPARCFSE